MVSNAPTRPADGSGNCPRLGDPITDADLPVDLQINAPFLWIAAAPLLYTSGFLAVYVLGSQFSRHIAP